MKEKSKTSYWEKYSTKEFCIIYQVWHAPKISIWPILETEKRTECQNPLMGSPQLFNKSITKSLNVNFTRTNQLSWKASVSISPSLHQVKSRRKVHSVNLERQSSMAHNSRSLSFLVLYWELHLLWMQITRRFLKQGRQQVAGMLEMKISNATQ